MFFFLSLSLSASKNNVPPQYEPVFDSAASIPFMQHIILYECQGASPELELMSREQGRMCYRPNNPPLSCNAIVATWAKGSEVFA